MKTLSTAVTLLALTLFGCAKPPPEPVVTGPVGLNHPELTCVGGTIGLGTPPPAGNEIYCGRVLVDGTVVRHGPIIRWHSPTRRASRGEYGEDKRIGEWQMWHPTGAPKAQGRFVADRREGLWKTFHEDGAQASEGQYVAGKETGQWTYWTADGRTMTTGQYRNGLRDGIWTDMNENGTGLRERKYRDGRMVSQHEITQQPAPQ